VLRLWGLPFGLSLESTAVLMFLLYLVAVCGVAHAARVAFGREAAIVAAAVLATHPLNLLWDTTTLADGLGVVMLTVALALYVTYLRSDRLGALAGAGILIGLTISVKEYLALFALPCLLVLIVMRLAGRQTSWSPRRAEMPLCSSK
jgi:4-amino-4-deoxy-L-arabinose transferase-like glycosyltransferase